MSTTKQNTWVITIFFLWILIAAPFGCKEKSEESTVSDYVAPIAAGSLETALTYWSQGEQDKAMYELLDVHRIIHGKDGGKYESSNCICLCTSCHRKHHSGLITIKQWYSSSKGKVLYYIDENGEDQFK